MTSVGRHGDGGITARRDGRLQVSITLTSGQRIYRTIPRLTDRKRQRELAERARRELVALREAEIDPAGQLLADYLRSWLSSIANAANPRIRPHTLAFYQTIAEKHLIPVLGEVRIETLRERHVQDWLDGLRLSPQYVAHCRAFLRRVLNVAVRTRVLDRNVAVAVELPPIPRYRAAVLSVPEAQSLLRATAIDRLGVFWRVALVTGLRVGELLALSWDDIEFITGTITVRSQLSRQNGEWVRAETKAARSLEEITVDPTTLTALEAHRTRQASERTADWPYWGLVFTTPTGYPIHRRVILDAFRDACDRAGIARRRIHDLRHSNATMLRELGVSRETRKARLGHTSDQMAERYARPSQVQDRAAVEQLARLLAGEF